MALQKYDVVRTMIPYSTMEDNQNRHKTLNLDRIMEAQMTGEFKYDRPCVVIGQDKKTGNVIMAEMRSDRTKQFRSLVNDFIDAGIPHESAILVHQDSLIHVEPDMIPIIDGDKCGHLSEKDIARFEYEFMETNFNRHISQQHETTTNRQMRIRNEMKQNLEPTDKELLNKLETAESNLSSSKDYSNDYERWFIMSEKKLDIPEYQLEDLLDGFEGYQNHFEWEDIPSVGREI